MTDNFELTINPNYVRYWDTWSALREIIQNAVDAHDLGHKMDIRYNEKENKLCINNYGITLTNDSLLLGTSTKTDKPSQRGQFGEGFKLAWLTLTREGKSVECISGNNKWIPYIEYSDTFNTDLLKVEVSKEKLFKNGIYITITGIDQKDWYDLHSNLLFEPFVDPSKIESIKVGNHGSILIDSKHKGRLFVKGIWVSDLHNSYEYGYNFENLKLDRDRKLADQFDLQWQIKNILEEACASDLIPVDSLYDMLISNRQEAYTIQTYIGFGMPNIAKNVCKKFRELHEEAIPVCTTSESLEIAHYGLKSVITPKVIKELVEHVEGTLEDRKKSLSLAAKHRYSIDELTDEEIENIVWATDLVKSVCKHKVSVTVVEFSKSNALGCYCNGETMVAKKVISDRSELISTIVHEVAHIAGADGTIEHSRTVEKIFGDIVNQISRG